MPRLTTKNYLELHHDLAIAHEDEPLLFGSLTVTEQWELHAYFVPTKDLTDDELIEHRRTITKGQPSLPQRAGRALAHFKLNFTKAAVAAEGNYEVFRHTLSELAPSKAVVTKRGRYVRTVGITNPEPDGKLMIRALLGFVDQLGREQQAERKQRESA